PRVEGARRACFRRTGRLRRRPRKDFTPDQTAQPMSIRVPSPMCSRMLRIDIGLTPGGFPQEQLAATPDYSRNRGAPLQHNECQTPRYAGQFGADGRSGFGAAGLTRDASPSFSTASFSSWLRTSHTSLLSDPGPSGTITKW